jgi:cytochrome o ubiquinol oxidase operon protein cyoD
VSAHTDVHADHGHDEHHDHDDGIGHVSLKGYMIGFVLAVLLTAVPFALVMSGGLKDPSATAFVILGFAAVQIVVHMVYFLHMNAKSEGGWNMLALIFTAVLVLITLSGSIWVMYHLNHNMMPALMDPRNLP